MTTSYWANVITTDVALGNAIAAAIDPDDGSTTFGGVGTGLRPQGSDGGATAWATSAPITEAGKLAFDEFSGPGPYPILNALGFDDAAVAALKAVLTVDYGPRAEHESNLVGMIEAAGLVPVPKQ